MMKFVKFATAFISAVLLLPASGYAKDYRLDYGIETPTDSDAGSTACPYGVCHVKVEKLNLTVIISLSRDDPYHARIQIEGKPGCCFFELGARSQRIVPGDPRRGFAFLPAWRREASCFSRMSRLETFT